jgi:hypothetical protein
VFLAALPTHKEVLQAIHTTRRDDLTNQYTSGLNPPPIFIIDNNDVNLINQEETYDPLSQAQKIMMLPNGLYEFSDIPNITCVCSHKFIDHLDAASLCLSKGQICLCEQFRETWNQTTVTKSRDMEAKF